MSRPLQAGRFVAFSSAQVLGLCDERPSWGGHSALHSSSGPLPASPRKVRHLSDMPKQKHCLVTWVPRDLAKPTPKINLTSHL